MKCLELFSSPLAFSLPHAVRFTVCSVGRVLPSSFNDLLWITVQTCDVTSPAPPQCHVLFHRPQTSWRCPLNKWHTCLSSGVLSSSQEHWASSHRHFLHVLFPSSLSSVCFGGVREAVVLLPSSASLVFCQQIDLSLVLLSRYYSKNIKRLKSASHVHERKYGKTFTVNNMCSGCFMKCAYIQRVRDSLPAFVSLQCCLDRSACPVLCN